MRLFISWSGESSRQVALGLQTVLRKLPIGGLQIFLSATAIQPGDRWAAELGDVLERFDFGILCLNGSNIVEPWILFESGALTKHAQTSGVVPYLLGVRPDELPQPLKQFQAVSATKQGTLSLVDRLHSLAGNEHSALTDVHAVFDMFWPELEETLGEAITADQDSTSQAPDQLTKLTDLVEVLAARVASWERRLQVPERGPSSEDPDADARGHYLMTHDERLAFTSRERSVDEQISELIRQGDFLLDKNPAGALTFFRDVLDLVPGHVTARINMGKAYKRMGDPEKAIELLEEVLRDQPETQRAIYNISCLKTLVGSYPLEEILADLKHAVDLQSGYRQYAQVDPDFDRVRDDPAFVALVGSAGDDNPEELAH